MVRVLFKLLPPGTSIQALVMFVPGARMSTTMVVSWLALPLVFMRGGLTLAIVRVVFFGVGAVDSSNSDSSWL